MKGHCLLGGVGALSLCGFQFGYSLSWVVKVQRGWQDLDEANNLACSRTHTHTRAHVRGWLYRHTCMLIRTHTRTHARTHAHTHTHTHTHTHLQGSSRAQCRGGEKDRGLSQFLPHQHLRSSPHHRRLFLLRGGCGLLGSEGGVYIYVDKLILFLSLPLSWCAHLVRRTWLWQSKS